ncbi:glycosyltransferase family 2 protein [Cognatilysobacter bugurensis]|uniref:glycosyltransferase family 2 protein n=1 Tax=Cognatilysobacter bugurensis TaxID=543356 RepID=UPI001E620A09|nr:glycosyltransferase family 2 protein [Lysobacter bugurensis]
MELTILMPCLNEAETVATCVGKAHAFLRRRAVEGEVLVADNGSTDGSQTLAEQAGARVIAVPGRGYGAALKGGIAAARGRYVIMGDADDSYDFGALDGVLGRLREGNELVMGDRFAGGIRQGAMPWLHRYLGNPVLSFVGRLFFRVPIRDFHCGLRGFCREAMRSLELSTDGMEFASEMVVKSALHDLRIAQVPVTLSPDGRSRPPHLRTWRDGWRHLKFLLLFSPRWLFLLPGLALLGAGSLAMCVIALRPVQIGTVGFDIHTLAYAGGAVLLGFQMVFFAVFTKLMGIRSGWLPEDPRRERWLAHLTLERALALAVALFVLGIGLAFQAIGAWSETGFGALSPEITMRSVIPSVTSLALAGELFLAGFFLEALRLPLRLGGRRTKRGMTVLDQELQ